MASDLLALALCVGISFISAADEFEDEVRALLTVSRAMEGAAAMASGAIDAQQAGLVDQLLQQYQAAGKEVTRDDVESLISDFRVQFLQQLVEQIELLVIDEYRSNFSLDEIREVRRIMENPAIVKFNTRSLNLMQAAQARAMQTGSRIAGEIMQQLIAANPKFQ